MDEALYVPSSRGCRVIWQLADMSKIPLVIG
jgi:hypothetical protein